jgi:hypothetical protein
VNLRELEDLRQQAPSGTERTADDKQVNAFLWCNARARRIGLRWGSGTNTAASGNARSAAKQRSNARRK